MRATARSTDPPREVHLRARLMSDAWARICAMFPSLRKHVEIRLVRFGAPTDEAGGANLVGAWRYVFKVYDRAASAVATDEAA